MESIQKLRCQGDFGNQNKTFPAKLFGSLHRADVNFGFAAASDAVQQKSFEAAHFDSTFDCTQRVVLLGGQVKSHWNVDCQWVGRGKKLAFFTSLSGQMLVNSDRSERFEASENAIDMRRKSRREVSSRSFSLFGAVTRRALFVRIPPCSTLGFL